MLNIIADRNPTSNDTEVAFEAAMDKVALFAKPTDKAHIGIESSSHVLHPATCLIDTWMVQISSRIHVQDQYGILA